MVVRDMIMSGMSGGEAYDRLKEVNPDIFESKYLDRSFLVLTTFMLRPSSFLSKPMARPKICVK